MLKGLNSREVVRQTPLVVLAENQRSLWKMAHIKYSEGMPAEHVRKALQFEISRSSRRSEFASLKTPAFTMSAWIVAE